MRVSAVQGRGGDSFHADSDQVRDVEAYAERRGASVVFMEPELSVSGGKAIRERPSLLRAIEGVESGEFDGIVVAYLSRLTRSRSGLEIWERVEAAGGHVHCAAEDLDTSTPNGRFIRDIHLANAVREREEHQDRFEQRRRSAALAGVWAANPPRGYVRDPQTRKLVPGPDAEAVRRAFRDRPSRSIAKIAGDLAMTTNGVRRMLRNPVYLGVVRVGDTVHEGAHEPLVTVEEWQAANASWQRPARLPGREPALLAGIVRCAGCGHVMSRADGVRYAKYRCNRSFGGGQCPAPSSISCGLLDEYVEPLALSAMRRLSVTDVERGGDVERLAANVQRAEEELNAYLVAVSALDNIAAFQEGAEVRRVALEEARRSLSVVAPASAPQIASAVDAWELLSVSERNAVLRDLLEVVLVRRAADGALGRGVNVADRAVVVVAGTGVLPAGVGRGIVTVDWPDGDRPGTLREL